jgi:hypothetical protein
MGGRGSGRHASRVRVEHATVQGYARGCRCGRCRGAWATYMRERRAKEPRRRKPNYYHGRAEEKVFRLTSLGAEILEAAQHREQRAPGDIVEHLLRLYAVELAFNEEAAA